MATATTARIFPFFYEISGLYLYEMPIRTHILDILQDWYIILYTRLIHLQCYTHRIYKYIGLCVSSYRTSTTAQDMKERIRFFFMLLLHISTPNYERERNIWMGLWHVRLFCGARTKWRGSGRSIVADVALKLSTVDFMSQRWDFFFVGV